MTTCNDGYVAGIDYTYGYFRELSPALLSLVLLNRAVRGNGARAPRYLELGFGQGVSLAIHAAACEGEFWGTDFNPAHAAHARELVAAAGVDARIFDQSFAEFAARDDLPQFDVITLHGIWSWIAPENRAAIVDLVGRRLAVGGTLYLSYNALPGCAPLQPMQQVMALQARLGEAAIQPMPQKMEHALRFTRSLIDAGARYFDMNPSVAERFAKVAQHDRNYLAHEYLNAHWQPQAFHEVQAVLGAARLDFIGSARLDEHLDALHVTPPCQALLDDITDPVLRESMRDIMMNTQFRADVFVRGGLPSSDLQRHAAYLATRFLLVRPVAQVPMAYTTAIGELVFDESVYRPLLAALASDAHAAKPLATLRSAPGLADKALESMIQALLVLNAMGHVYPAQCETDVASARPRCKALNGMLLRQACFVDNVRFLASPVTGAGHAMTLTDRLFLLARSGGLAPEQWPGFVCNTVTAADPHLCDAGGPFADVDQALQGLVQQAESFIALRLPILQALGIA